MSRKVLWIHQNYVGRNQPGNARATLLLDALARRGHQVDLIATTRSYLGGGEGGPEAGVEEEGGIRVHRLPAPAAGDRGKEYLSFLRDAVPYALRLGRPDVIFTSSPSLPQVAPALLLSGLWRRPVVLEIRDLWPAFLEEGGLLRPGPMMWAMRALEGAAMRHGAEVVLVGPAYRPYVEAMGVDPARITVAPTGGLAEPAPAGARAAWRAAHQLDGRVVILYAGSFNEAYDLEVVLAAAARLAPLAPEVAWVFVGDGRARPLIEAAARDREAVRYLGAVPRAQMREVLAGADVGLNPHADWPLLGITISGKVFDAMSAGVPVLSLRGGTMGAMVRAAGCGVVADQPTAEALAEAALGLAQAGEEARQALGERGRAWVMEQMPAEAMAERVCDALERLVPGPQRRRLLASLAGGALDAALSRGPKAIRAVYGEGLDQLARETLERWLHQP
ncbi:MAG: glycosyltransferase family 4 protein [Deltaproteobacteria bacterium]|nr:glycosyltransferase family 4 protein [Deltaproteobacteria bacterium]